MSSEFRRPRFNPRLRRLQSGAHAQAGGRSSGVV